MRTILTILLAAMLRTCALAPAALAQEPSTPRAYYVTRTVTATSNTVTIETSASRQARLLGVWVYCANACTATVSKGGTVSSGSTGTISKLDDRAPAPGASAVYDGTVSGATTVIAIPVAAVGSTSLGGGMRIASDSQFTVSLASASGELRIHVQYEEP